MDNPGPTWLPWPLLTSLGVCSIGSHLDSHRRMAPTPIPTRSPSDSSTASTPVAEQIERALDEVTSSQPPPLPPPPPQGEWRGCTLAAPGLSPVPRLGTPRGHSNNPGLRDLGHPSLGLPVAMAGRKLGVAGRPAISESQYLSLECGWGLPPRAAEQFKDTRR